MSNHLEFTALKWSMNCLDLINVPFVWGECTAHGWMHFCIWVQTYIHGAIYAQTCIRIHTYSNEKKLCMFSEMQFWIENVSNSANFSLKDLERAMRYAVFASLCFKKSVERMWCFLDLGNRWTGDGVLLIAIFIC